MYSKIIKIETSPDISLENWISSNLKIFHKAPEKWENIIFTHELDQLGKVAANL